jgi:hypothetical protein
MKYLIIILSHLWVQCRFKQYGTGQNSMLIIDIKNTNLSIMCNLKIILITGAVEKLKGNLKPNG